MILARTYRFSDEAAACGAAKAEAARAETARTVYCILANGRNGLLCVLN